MKKINDKKFGLASVIATFLNVGNVKYAPGTFGSLATFPLFLIINACLVYFGVSYLWQVALIYFLIVLALFYVAYWSIDVYVGTNKKDDPSEVVIDEVLGQMIAFVIPMLLTLYYFSHVISTIYFNFSFSIVISLILIIAPIMFFRVFDILKPGLVGYFDDNIRGPFGIIMDDVVAGLYAGFLVSLILVSLFVGVSFIK